jgi:transposase
MGTKSVRILLVTDALDNFDLSVLPEPVRAALQAQQVLLEQEREARLALTEQVSELAAYNSRLEHLLKEYRDALYGKSSEKIDPDQMDFFREDIETAIAETQAAAETRGLRAPSTAKRNIGRLPSELPRIEKIIEPASTLCPCGCGQMVRIGEDRTERLYITPAHFQVVVTVRPKYACRTCESGVTQAPAPAHLIEGGLPTEALIAHVLVAKYADHLPLYRQSQGFARLGLYLDRSTLAGWVGKAAFHLSPIVDRLAEKLKTSTKLFMDETTAPVLDPGRGRTKTGYLWALARDDRSWGGDDPPGVVYFYADGRSGKHAEEFLHGFTGILQVDGYAGYNRLTRAGRNNGPIQLAYCWAHARRKLKEIFDASGSPIADEGLRRIAELYAIEKEIRGCDAETRLAVRIERSAPLVKSFGDWLKEKRSRISVKSRLGEKLTYIANHWEGLQVFLTDGRIEMDSNLVENKIRPLALGRKNHLFAGHDEGAHAWARIASLVETCKANDVNPFAYLKTTLEAIAAGHPTNRLDDLLPWAFACGK